tara:strand:- start:1291 stop:1593 length:303 start_codon:yes stop_codon:yes gene_type:complete
MFKKKIYPLSPIKSKLSLNDINPEYWVEILLPSHKVIDMDDRMCEILNYKKEELIGNDFRPLMLSHIMQKYLNEVYNTKITLSKLNKIIKEITKLRYMSF